MKYRGLTLLLSVLFIAFCATAVARGAAESKSHKQRKSAKVSTEFGLGILGKYTFLDVVPIGDFPHNVTTNFGVGASLQFRLNFGKFVGIQPEVQYAFSTLKFKSTNGAYDSPIKVKENLVQMPILLSFKVGIVYFNAGPVFRLMDNPTYTLTNHADNTTSQFNLGNLTPLISYAAGVGIKLPKGTMVDLRYTGQFKDIKTTNAFLGTLDVTKQATAHEFRTRNSGIQLRFGFVF